MYKSMSTSCCFIHISYHCNLPVSEGDGIVTGGCNGKVTPCATGTTSERKLTFIELGKAIILHGILWNINRCNLKFYKQNARGIVKQVLSGE